MNICEKKILDDIKEMLALSYQSIVISMETFLEHGEGTCLNMSSLEIVQFIVDLETKYDIIIDFDERYYTIGDVVKSIQSYIYEKDNFDERIKDNGTSI